MKHSKKYLGITTFVLGIAGAFSTIGSNKFVANSKVFTSIGSCILWTTTCNCDGLGIGPKCTTRTVLHRTVFTIRTNCLHTCFRFI
jgi:hypothetical protein